MIENPVFVPIQCDAKFEINRVSELGYRQNIHQSCGHLHLHRDHGQVQGVDGEGRHLAVVALLEHNELAAVLVRLVPAVDDLVAPLLHADALAVAAGELPVPAPSQLQNPPVIRDT